MQNFTANNQARIKKLSPLLINQLSAGEVVTRPASVVKELLENAIDAGASQINIRITQGGMGLIEMVDNGNGIHPDDMLMAVTRHATSKVADVEQLQGISTLGFRGEALASISAVSRLTLISSHDDSGVGRSLSIAGQLDNPDITPVVCAKGTTVRVKDLYFNVPARRGNLKSVQTEYAHIEAVIRHLALVYPKISLSLYHENKSRLQLAVNENTDADNPKNKTENLARFKQAWGNGLPEPAYPLRIDLSVLQKAQVKRGQVKNRQVKGKQANNISTNDVNPSAEITGWLWLTNDSKPNHKSDLPKLIYVNNRLVKDTAISQQIRQTISSLSLPHPSSPSSADWQQYQQQGQQYGYALFFTLPSDWLNLNVHPSKQRISIHTLANINAHLHHGIQQLLTSIDYQQSHSHGLSHSQPAPDQPNPSEGSISNTAPLDNHASDFHYPIHHPKKRWQVASPKTKAVYQVDGSDGLDSNRVHGADSANSLNRSDADDGDKANKVNANFSTAVNSADSASYLNISDDLERFVSIVHNPKYRPIVTHLLSQAKNFWVTFRQLQQQMLNQELLKEVDLSADIFVMWTELPSDDVKMTLDATHASLDSNDINSHSTDTNSRDKVLLVVFNRQTYASKSLIYPLNSLKAT